MAGQTVRALNQKVASLDGYKRVLNQQLDHVHDRAAELERLLRIARSWFDPHTDNKWCTFCAAEVGQPHTDSCPYPKWAEQVTYLIGPK